MPDLTDELRRLAADAASRATPAAITDVIRRGNRRRRRTMAQRSAGGLSVLGLSAAVLITGAAHQPAAPASPTAAAGVTTLTETTSSATGTMTIRVRYRSVPSGWARLLSITYSGSARASAPRPALVLTLRPLSSAPARRLYGVSVAIRLSQSELGHFTGSVPLRLLRQLDKGKPVSGTLIAVLGGPFSPANHVKKHVSPPPFRELATEGLIVG
jgi:hypothetical protein